MASNSVGPPASSPGPAALPGTRGVGNPLSSHLHRLLSASTKQKLLCPVSSRSLQRLVGARCLMALPWGWPQREKEGTAMWQVAFLNKQGRSYLLSEQEGLFPFLLHGYHGSPQTDLLREGAKFPGPSAKSFHLDMNK